MYVPDRKQKKVNFSLPYDFPIRLFHTDLDALPGHVNQWHWHDELQFLLCTSGKICVTVEKDSFFLSAGDALFINADLLHTTRACEDTSAAYATLNIDLQLLTSFPGSRIEQLYLQPFRTDRSLTSVTLSSDILWQKDILSHIHQIIQHLQDQPPACELLVCAELYNIWALLICHARSSSQTPALLHHHEIKQVLQYLHLNYAAPLSLDTLALAVNHNKSSLCRLFKQDLHCTITAYLTAYRLAKSQELLLQTDLSVTDIAYACGFQDTSYYIRRFREAMHCTPLQWRKQYT